MRATVSPGGYVGGETTVPVDKSVAHRWLILAATAAGTTELLGLPHALDVRSTARSLAALVPEARAALEAWASAPRRPGEPQGFTINKREPRPGGFGLTVAGRARSVLEAPAGELDCGNSGTTMRLLAGVLAAVRFECVLLGDDSLGRRPMERVAAPLREMGADVRTTQGYPPVRIRGATLRGIRHRVQVPSAQVKGAVLLAGVAAEGETTIEEPAPTRDHTERALSALGGPVRREARRVTVSAFQYEGFAARVPGDVSSAAFLVASAALTGGDLTVRGVGLNPSRTHFLDVIGRMGVRVEQRIEGEQLGEPFGDLHVAPCDGLSGTSVTAHELPLVIDEVPMLAALAAHADGESRFEGARELKVKESDRLEGLAGAILGLGGQAGVDGEDLVVAGGGLEGGVAGSLGDHRMAMALVVAALRARGPSTVEGIEVAGVSFPGFVRTLRALGARIEG